MLCAWPIGSHQQLGRCTSDCLTVLWPWVPPSSMPSATSTSSEASSTSTSLSFSSPLLQCSYSNTWQSPCSQAISWREQWQRKSQAYPKDHCISQAGCRMSWDSDQGCNNYSNIQIKCWLGNRCSLHVELFRMWDNMMNVSWATNLNEVGYLLA